MSKRSRRKNRRQFDVPVPRQSQTPETNQNNLFAINGQDSMAKQVLDRLSSLGIVASASSSASSTAHSVLPTLQEQMAATLARSVENQKHYIESASRNKNLWFQNPRLPYQYSEFVYLTPEMTKQLLECNQNPRKKTPSVVNAYSRDIEAGRWLQTDESITINVALLMHNGQHRAEAIIKANIACPMYVTWNVPVEAQYVQDSGHKRTVQQKLKLIIGARARHKMPALCRAMMGGVQRMRYTESEIAEFALQFEDLIAWVNKQLPSFRADVMAVVAKASLIYGRETLEPFCEQLRTVVFKSQDDPANTLYRWLQKIKASSGYIEGVGVYKKTIAAIDAFLENRTLRALYERDTDVFEWESGWTVPKK